ncbi:MAG: c-type cytochrome [Bdellovibrionales bacterium]|nr:c-type cytochrome [Bdellovibrionales bacterium]
MSDHKHQHHIMSKSMALKVWGALMVLTFVTVVVAQIDLGAANFVVAMIVATIKASLVCLFFMGLKYDDKENAVIFCTSFIFLTIFMILTFGDLLTRGDVYVKDGKIIPDGAIGQTKSKFVKPWIATPEMIAHGKELYASNCVVCHGPEGKGDGPGGAALNPHPRNFTQAADWKNGRKPSQIFETLTKGLNAMPSFSTASTDDRWSLVHYVRTLGPHESEKDTPEDLKKIGIDPTKEDGGGGAEKAIPIGLAIDRMTEDKGGK